MRKLQVGLQNKIYPDWLSDRKGKTKQWSDLCWLKKVIFGKQYRPNGLFLVPVAKRWLMVSRVAREGKRGKRVAREGGLVDRLCDGFLLAASRIFHHQHIVFISISISTLCSSHLAPATKMPQQIVILWRRTSVSEVTNGNGPSPGDLFSFVEKAVFITRCLQKNC